MIFSTRLKPLSLEHTQQISSSFLHNRLWSTKSFSARKRCAGGVLALRVLIHPTFCSSSYRSRDIGKKLKYANFRTAKLRCLASKFNFLRIDAHWETGYKLCMKVHFYILYSKMLGSTGFTKSVKLKISIFLFSTRSPIDSPLG